MIAQNEVVIIAQRGKDFILHATEEDVTVLILLGLVEAQNLGGNYLDGWKPIFKSPHLKSALIHTLARHHAQTP